MISLRSPGNRFINITSNTAEMDHLGTVILAGHNEGSDNLLKEYIEKKTYSFLYSLFSDSFIFGANKPLLPVTPDPHLFQRESLGDLAKGIMREINQIRTGSIEAFMEQQSYDHQRRVINNVVDAVNGCAYTKKKYTVAVGPKSSLERIVGSDADVIAQGRTIAENAQVGARHLYQQLGYDNDYFLIVCGDLSAIKQDTINGFMDSVRRKDDGKTTLYVGVACWNGLKDLIENNDLEQYGKMGLRFFPFVPGRINKFGMTVIDDNNTGTKPLATKRYSWANMFLAHRSLIDHPEMTSYLYNHKRAFLDPHMAYSVIQTAGWDRLWKLLVTKTLPVTEAEDIVSSIIRQRFPQMPSFQTKVAEAPPEALLDIDTIMDYRRNAALVSLYNK
jgi:hypothetical protein